jgi:hypothetical protein
MTGGVEAYFVRLLASVPFSRKPMIVIPGRTEGASPEPMNTDLAAEHNGPAQTWRTAVFLGSGLSAPPSLGMTMESD